MGRNNYFQFKQFKIIQEKSAMKVGTDGVLIGAWTNVANAKNILDIGTGTGLISLMLAQRCEGQITAIEIEKNAAMEAKENIANSPWNNRVEVENISFQEFVKKTSRKYDLIVSNPPFFVNSVQKKTLAQTTARHTDSLFFTELLRGVVKLLNSNGRFSLVLPFAASEDIIEKARVSGLNLSRKSMVKPKLSKMANRCLLEFNFSESTWEENELIIYNELGTDFSAAYKLLTKEFYLKF